MVEIIHVLIVDDHPIVREALTTLISSESGMEVLGTAVNGQDAIEKAASLHPDIILMDLVMPRMDGVHAITEIMHQNPSARILVLTSFDDDDRVLKSIQAGAAGYMLKDSKPEELLEAIRKVHAMQPFVQPEILAKLMNNLKFLQQEDNKIDTLTTREVEILKILAHGEPNQVIAGQLNISERTVTKHISNILDKLGLANRTQAAYYAIHQGLVDPGEKLLGS